MKITAILLGPLKTNCYILTDEGSGETAVIDPGVWEASLGGAFDEESVKKIKYILLTHGHFDHILGVHELKRLSGAEVLIHKADADCLYDERRSLLFLSPDDSRYDEFIKYIYPLAPGQQIPVHADAFLSDGDILRLGETEIRVVHTPGHSAGSVCFIADGNVFSGDTLFRLTVGRTDFKDGDEKALLASLMRLMELPDEYAVYPGHHRPTAVGFERVKNHFLRHVFN